MERIEGLVAQGQAIDAAYLTNFAFADPERLKSENDRYQAALRRLPHVPAGKLDERTKADVLRIMATWARQPAEVS